MHTNTQKDLISVVIPAYNCGKYIPETLDSILNQTYRNFEIVVVDDGSTDDTQEALRPYSGKIKYFHQKNGGLANARNRGLELAKGSYLALCDGDDIWLPNKLELQHACFEVHNRLGMVFSDFSSFNDAGPLAPSWSKKYFNTIFENYGLTLDSIFQKKINLHDLNTLYAGNITTTMFLGNIVMPSTVMIKRECINSVGKFREKYKNDSDYDLFLRIAAEYESGYLDLPLMKYRILKNSLSQRSKKQIIGVPEVIDIIETFLEQRPSFRKKNLRMVNQRFSGLFYETGYAHFSRVNLKEARKYFLKAIRHHPLPLASLKVYAYMAASLLPQKVIASAKNLKNLRKASSGIR